MKFRFRAASTPPVRDPSGRAVARGEGGGESPGVQSERTDSSKWIARWSDRDGKANFFVNFR